MLAILLLALLSSDLAFSKPLGTASFHAEGLGLALDIDGEGASVDGDVVKSGSTVSGVFKVKAADFKTGIGERDRHMCDALECGKYPLITFKLDAVEPKEGAPVSGELELHGKRLKVSGWKVDGVKGSEVTVVGTVKLKDYGIEPPTYKIAKVSNEVELKIVVQI